MSQNIMKLIVGWTLQFLPTYKRDGKLEFSNVGH